MVLIPHLTIDGGDYSRYFLSCHAEQTTNDPKDENKYDVTLANINGRLTGKFVPKTRITLTVTNRRHTCQGSTDEEIQIFDGEVQDVSADETTCKISGSCDQGGMASSIEESRSYEPGTPFSKIVEDILAMFGYSGPNPVIKPVNEMVLNKNFQIFLSEGFNEAMQQVADESMSVWYWGEDGVFYFVSPYPSKGESEYPPGFPVVADEMSLVGVQLESQVSQNMEGYCNVVRIIGGSPGPLPSEDGSENKSHRLIFAEAPGVDLEDYGTMIAPPILKPQCPQVLCDKISRNTLNWFLQFKNVATVKVVGKAPLLHSLVSYVPYNGNLPANDCEGGSEAVPAGVLGFVTRRVIDFSSDGLVCTLNIATQFGDEFESYYIPGVVLVDE
jgi:hypothetical protein